MEKRSIYNYFIPIEYRSPINDVIRMITLQVTTNFLICLSKGNYREFLGKDFIQTLIFIILGIGLYWLVIRKIITFGSTSSKNNDDKFYYGSQ